MQQIIDSRQKVADLKIQRAIDVGAHLRMHDDKIDPQLEAAQKAHLKDIGDAWDAGKLTQYIPAQTPPDAAPANSQLDHRRHHRRRKHHKKILRNDLHIHGERMAPPHADPQTAEMALAKRMGKNTDPESLKAVTAAATATMGKNLKGTSLGLLRYGGMLESDRYIAVSEGATRGAFIEMATAHGVDAATLSNPTVMKDLMKDKHSPFAKDMNKLAHNTGLLTKGGHANLDKVAKMFTDKPDGKIAKDPQDTMRAALRRTNGHLTAGL